MRERSLGLDLDLALRRLTARSMVPRARIIRVSVSVSDLVESKSFISKIGDSREPRGIRGLLSITASRVVAPLSWRSSH